jgi:hypothetical protein
MNYITQGYSLHSIAFFQIIKRLRGIGVEVVKKDNHLKIKQKKWT